MPRTQTSDELPTPKPVVFRLAARSAVTSGLLLFRNQMTKAALIVTTMDLFHRNGASGDVAYISLNSTSPGIFGAEVGSGSFDTFSWRGEFGLAPNEYLQSSAVTGVWDFTAHGYYVPYFLSFPTS